MSRKYALVVFLVAALCVGCSKSDNKQVDGGDRPAAAVTGPAVTRVSDERLVDAGSDTANWLSHGRTYDEQRFSPLDQINRDNVGELGLAWYFDVPTRRGMEATPIVVDGLMYVTGSWSIVYALDAATGEELWRYDPKVPKSWAQYACCDVVNRGVAVWEDSVFVGTLDGCLVALDAATGKERWRTDTIDRQAPYTITGAPRVVNGLVVIGNGGAEFGVRGYVSAYDAETGEHALALLHRARQPRGRLRERGPGEGRADLDRRVVEDRRRRHGLGLDGLRPGARPALHRRRQRLALEPEVAQPRRRRQPVPVLDRRAAPRHRRVRLALPDHARRHLGLHRDPAHDPGRPRDRRRRRARC